MRHNMGKNERFSRILIGIALFIVSLWFGFTGMLALQLTVALAGLALTLTGVFAYCPVNASLRHNSCHACKIGETHGHLPV
jgi:uncharacterized membrane protein HdeD (DUF308 family)